MGKDKIWPSANLKTPEPIVTKFEWRNYVVDPYHQKIGWVAYYDNDHPMQQAYSILVQSHYTDIYIS